jgi:hypothetical protein
MTVVKNKSKGDDMGVTHLIRRKKKKDGKMASKPGKVENSTDEGVIRAKQQMRFGDKKIHK